MNSARRIQFFSILARYHEAGLPLDAALQEIAQHDASVRQVARRTAALVHNGMPLDRAGSQTGLLQPWEARLLELGALHGRLDLTLTEISGHYQKSAAWWRKLRSRLLLPGFVLLLGWLLLPLPKLISGDLGVSRYIMQNVGVALLLWLAWRWLGRTQSYPALLDSLHDIKPVGNLLRSWHRSNLLGAIARLTEAGVPLQQGVAAAVASCRSPRLRRHWQGIVASLRQGGSVTASLQRYQVLDATGQALVDSGEASGKLVEMLIYERDRLDKQIDLQLGILAEWLPRLIYFAVLLLLFNSII
jgi:type II secretory pathway component PulF